MNKSLLFFCLLVISLNSSGQTQPFEGKILYKGFVKTTFPILVNGQPSMSYSYWQEFYIKGGDHRSDIKGYWTQWEIYINEHNKLYYKMWDSNTIAWKDGNVKVDKLIKTKILRNNIRILGYVCDKVILTTRNEVRTFYFNAALAIDSKLFEKYKQESWYDFLAISNAVPLMYTIEDSSMSLEAAAVEITPMKVDPAIFQLPPELKVDKKATN